MLSIQKDSGPTGIESCSSITTSLYINFPLQLTIQTGSVLYKLSATFSSWSSVCFRINFCSNMGRLSLVLVWSLCLSLCMFSNPTSAQLKTNFYANVCPNVESIVKNAVTKKFQQTFVTVPATIRLFFHDCFVQVTKLNSYSFLWLGRRSKSELCVWYRVVMLQL